MADLAWHLNKDISAFLKKPLYCLPCWYSSQRENGRVFILISSWFSGRCDTPIRRHIKDAAVQRHPSVVAGALIQRKGCLIEEYKRNEQWVYPSRHETLNNVGWMLGQRRRRWANIQPMLAQRLGLCWEEAAQCQERPNVGWQLDRRHRRWPSIYPDIIATIHLTVNTFPWPSTTPKAFL